MTPPAPKAKKPKLRDLTRQPLSDDELKRLDAEFESAKQPIVIAILGLGFVEYELDICIRACLKQADDATWDKLVQDTGPLSTFSRKIALGYALGIYDEDTMANLNLLRTVRNTFAHSKRIINFDHPVLLVDLQKIREPKRLSKAWRKAWIEEKADNDGRNLFHLLCHICAHELLKIQTKRNRAKHQRLTRKVRELEQHLLASNPFTLPFELAASPTSGPGLLSSYFAQIQTGASSPDQKNEQKKNS